jgi:hypothetical protein
VTLHTGKGMSGEDVADDLDDLEDAEQLSSERNQDSADDEEEEKREGTALLVVVDAVALWHGQELKIMPLSSALNTCVLLLSSWDYVVASNSHLVAPSVPAYHSTQQARRTAFGHDGLAPGPQASTCTQPRSGGEGYLRLEAGHHQGREEAARRYGGECRRGGATQWVGEARPRWQERGEERGLRGGPCTVAEDYRRGRRGTVHVVRCILVCVLFGFVSGRSVVVVAVATPAVSPASSFLCSGPVLGMQFERRAGWCVPVQLSYLRNSLLNSPPHN